MELTIYFRINEEENGQYAGEVVLAENEKTEEDLRDKGNQMIEMAIRTLRKKGIITPVWPEGE